MRRNELTPASLGSVLRSTVLFTVLVLVVVRFIDTVATVFLIFSIITLITLVLNPVVNWLEHRKVPRWASAFGLAVLFIGFLAFIGWLIAPRVGSDFASLVSRIPKALASLKHWLAEGYPAAAAHIPGSSSDLLKEGINRLAPYAAGLLGYAGTLADVLVGGVVIFIGSIYTLSNPKPLAQGFVALFRPELRGKVTDAIQELSSQMLSWAFATMIAMLIVFVLVWIALSLLGVKGAFLIALVSGILEVVPVLGPLVSGGIAVLAALGQSPELAFWTLIIFVGIQQVEGHILIPLVMSGRLELHPASVIFAVLSMGALFGLVGVFLATPAAALVKVLVYKFWIEPVNASNGSAQDEIPEHAERIVRQTPAERQDGGNLDQEEPEDDENNQAS